LNSQNITAKQVAEAIGATLYGDGERHATDVTHDSRQAREGTLFVAIKGETTDGHRFIDDVIRRGAVGVV